MSKAITPNNREIIAAESVVTNQAEYLNSKNGALYVIESQNPIGSGSIATNQVSVINSATQIVASRAGRASVTIVNTGTTDVYLGSSSVTTSNGLLLIGTKGAAVTLDTTVAVYGIVASGSQTVSYEEEY